MWQNQSRKIVTSCVTLSKLTKLIFAEVISKLIFVYIAPNYSQCNTKEWAKNVQEQKNSLYTISSIVLEEYEGNEGSSPGFTVYLTCFSENFLILTQAVVFSSAFFCLFVFLNIICRYLVFRTQIFLSSVFKQHVNLHFMRSLKYNKAPGDSDLGRYWKVS